MEAVDNTEAGQLAVDNTAGDTAAACAPSDTGDQGQTGDTAEALGQLKEHVLNLLMMSSFCQKTFETYLSHGPLPVCWLSAGCSSTCSSR